MDYSCLNYSMLKYMYLDDWACDFLFCLCLGHMMEVCIFGPLQGRSLAFNIYVACQSGEWCLLKKSRNCRFLPKCWSFFPIVYRGLRNKSSRDWWNTLYTNLKLYWLQVSVFQGLDLFNLICSCTAFWLVEFLKYYL